MKERNRQQGFKKEKGAIIMNEERISIEDLCQEDLKAGSSAEIRYAHKNDVETPEMREHYDDWSYSNHY